MTATRIDPRIYDIAGVIVNGVTVIDENGNVDAPITTTNLTTTGNTTLGDTSSDATVVNGTLTNTNVYIAGQSARSGAGAVPLTAPTCLLTTTGADALTLADGSAGQRLRVIMIVDDGDGTLTPTTATGFTTLTFDDVGDSAEIEFVTTLGWMLVGTPTATAA